MASWIINLFEKTSDTTKDTFLIPWSAIANKPDIPAEVGTITGIKMNGASKGTSGVVDLGTVLTDESKFATAAQGTKADNAMPKSGGEFTGGISAPNISTGTNAANYFQTQKFRGEGNADTYYHAVDFGFAGHNQVDFHEYGGLYNFYQNTVGTADGGSLVGAFTPDGIKEGNQLLKDKYLGKSGGAVTGNLTVGGNLTVNGTTTTVDSTTLQVKDKLIEVAHGNTAALTTPAGLVAPKYDGTNSGALVFDSTGTAYVGDVTLKDGNIDVSKSGLQPLATRTGLVGGNLVQYDSTEQTLKDSGKKIGDLATLTGGNTFSGVQTINAPTKVSGSEQTTMKVKTSNGGAIIFGKEGPNDGTMIRLDQKDGTCRLRFRSSSTAGAMVWEQPEHGAKLHVDLGKDGSDKHRVTFPSSGGTLALTSQVNAKYTKPSGGIPKTDLASDVQTSLDKADSALSTDGGTINKSKTIKMDASANSDGANLKWGTVNHKNPYIGYASDQVDGTFVVGSLLGTNYASGLAIGGGSGNLLWKGAKVATTNDIPKVNNGTLTIQKNGADVQTFTANQSSSVTANITVPTKVSELTNDSGFITNAPANYTNSSRTPSQCTANGFYYVTSSTNSLTDADGNPFLQYHASNNDFRILATAYNSNWVQQIATDFRSTHIYYRIRNNGTWSAWTEVAKISDIPDVSGKANLSGGNTFTGKQTLTSPPADGYSIDASGYVKGSWLQAPSTGHSESGTDRVCVMSSNGWIYYRTPKEVIIDAECAVKYEMKKTINFGQDGVLYVGKFKVYDTNVTCEITSTTNVTYSGKLVIATQNYVISQMTVYGDAANTVAPNFFIKPSTTSDPYIEVYFKPSSWSKNVVHIYGSNIEAEPTDVCTNEPSIPSTATLKPKNALPIYSLSGTTLTITL